MLWLIVCDRMTMTLDAATVAGLAMLLDLAADPLAVVLSAAEASALAGPGYAGGLAV